MNKIFKSNLKLIKESIKELKSFREYIKNLEKKINEEYTSKIQEYSEEWFNQSIKKSLEEQRKLAISKLYENDSSFYLIYSDGREEYIFGEEILTGVNPKIQGIVYACYSDGYTEYDTLEKNLDNKWNLESDEGLLEREQYFANIKNILL
jgi:hypothetical protein